MIPHLQKIRAVVVVAMVVVSTSTLAAQPLTEGESLRIGMARSEVADLARGRIDAAWAQRFAGIERIVGKLRTAGAASGYDLRRLARERQAAQARRAQTRAELERAREQFAARLGVDSAQYAGIAGQLPPAAPADLAALLARLDARPDLAALAARASAAELEARAAGYPS